MYHAARRVKRCDVCAALNQVYPHTDGTARLTDGCFLLITPEQITFWGKSRLDRVNPAIKILPATGEMSEVIRNLIIDPPETPWMSFTFAKSNSSATLRVTENNSVLRFGGKFQIRKQNVSEINRDHVSAMAAVGMNHKEWEEVMQEYALGRSQKFLRTMEKKYPALTKLRILPPFNSPEYLALTLLIRPRPAKKGASINETV